MLSINGKPISCDSARRRVTSTKNPIGPSRHPDRNRRGGGEAKTTRVRDRERQQSVRGGQ
jgi:hypothetical protein